MPDGSLLGRGGASARTEDRPVLEVVRPQALFERLARHPKIGIGEAYMAGDWRAGEGHRPRGPAAAVRRAVDHPGAARAAPGSAGSSTARSRSPSATPSPALARNIEAHYDLSNDLFAAFLDETMTYSAAWFDDARPWSAAATGGGAAPQGRRSPRSGAGTAAAPGCWRSAPAGARSPSRPPGAVPTSPPSRSPPRRPCGPRPHRGGRPGRRASTCGCRTTARSSGTFDAIVSVEMIEAVGEEYWPTYFAVLDRLPRARWRSSRSRRS